MRRNAFGDPQPATVQEIIQAMDERDLQPEFTQALLYPPDDRDEPPFAGWTAEISDADTGDHTFSTLGFATREDLVGALKAAGITMLEEM